MAAAALLRSMARKLARAPPPPPPRPLLAGGLHGGAGCSLPPLTSKQIQQGSGDRLAVGMAAAQGLRSGAALPWMATKIARAPPQPHHRHVLNRALHSSTTAPPPTSDKDKIIEELRLRLSFARASAGIGGFMLTGIMIYGYFWLLPEVEKERQRLEAMPEDERPSVSLARIIAREGYRKQQSKTEKGTMVDKIPEELMEVCFDILKEITAGLDEATANLKETTANFKKARADLKESRAGLKETTANLKETTANLKEARANLKESRAHLKESRASIDRIEKLVPSNQKEGCSRVGSETVAC